MVYCSVLGQRNKCWVLPGTYFSANRSLQKKHGLIFTAPSKPLNVTILKDPLSPTLRIGWELVPHSEQDSVTLSVCRSGLCPEKLLKIKKRRGEIPSMYFINTEQLAQEVNNSFTVFATSYDLSGPRSSPVSFLTGECVWHATKLHHMSS